MKNLLSALLLTFIAFSMQAQQLGPNISWESPTHNFGDIQEKDGKVTHKFKFTNTGNEALVITRVKPSCGCTSSDYTKAPVKPGQKGYVSATFDPARRPGKFSKSITVTTNAKPPISTLRFTGNVIPKPKTKRDLYPRSMGKLWLKTSHVAFMKIKNNEVKKEDLKVYNNTDEDLTITFRNVPSHMSITTIPKVLKPKMEGVIKITYNAAAVNDWGFVNDRITVAVNGDTQQNRNRLTVSATITEDFSHLTAADLEKAPKIEFENKIYNFGTINQGEKRSYDFKFTNTGKQNLIIRKIRSTCGCTVVKPDKDVIKPGESSSLKATFNSAGKSNRQNKSITVITNDPKNPQTTLRVTGNVIKPGQTPANK